MSNSEHTTKSFHSVKRDKPRHSLKDHEYAKKGGAGGKGTWGSEKDDVKYMNEDGHAVDDQDPNFDPTDENEGSFSLAKTVFLSEEQTRIFENGMTDLKKFKQQVRSACDEYVVSHDAEEFIESVKDMQFSLYHQDLPAILVKHALDLGDEAREVIATLLHHLHKNGMVTSVQMATGFRKLYDIYDELVLDAPNAKMILGEFVGHGTAAGYLDAQQTAQMQADADSLANPDALQKNKVLVKDAVVEYLSSGEVEELSTAIKGVPSSMRYEVIKVLLTLAMDRADADRERASVVFAALVTSGAVSTEQAVKGVTILLNRVEDIFLDVPTVYRLLSLLIARGVVDEALPPSFLLRLDLSEADMGFKVAAHAKTLLKRERAAEELERVWGATPLADDDE